MGFNRFFLSAIAAGVAITATTPVQAAELASWQFDASQNQLNFRTTSSVQPTAQLISNPSRLVIDLPGTRLGRGTMRQSIGGVIDSVRAGQFNAQTTRLVVELAPGYTLDPQQVRFTGHTPNQWSVQLPTPIRTTSQTPVQPSNAALQITRNGFFLHLNRQQPQIDIERSENRRQIAITLNGAQLPEQGRQAIGRYGVESVDLQQLSSSVARLTLNVSPNSPDWFASASSRGLAIVPSGGMAVLREDTPTPETIVSLPDNDQISIPVPPPQSRPTPPANPTPRPSTPQPRIPSNTRVMVTIDPGHGGRDPGAIGLGGLREKDVILPISQEVARILERNGVTAMMTRSDDRFISLRGRTEMANRAGADLFVSIHANAVGGGRSNVNGAETFYYSTGYGLAREIQSSIIRNTGMNNRGVKRARFYVLRNTAMPAVLVEVGFVTGQRDAARLASPAFRSQMAEAIASGILNHIR
ncbi:N-acetylmuramoyl-L-alanine amidase [Spirulina sp. CS-785/01]|uniref:N-acetylmuramoyl-L-alanine amidase n=1 Tax=Spirulina sp. CS-785/01 TaxID=3021716 RepID=UPI00232AE8EC|nr:N-acetylmuramoyl-L-alanine amidase [Spirulina sp. CS-785/01]MDB9314705.1 N-acetylmuramoyl-L-alanine amidase [Spirulina sp. CS-785/01]